MQVSSGIFHLRSNDTRAWLFPVAKIINSTINQICKQEVQKDS